MRTTYNLNEGWDFSQDKPKDYLEAPVSSVVVNVPHSWNKFDGQDGGGDYKRGTFYYTKRIPYVERKDNSRVYLEFQGANSTANVYVNGKKAGRHEGGYSTFRFDVTDLLNTEFGKDNVVVVEVDNGADHVYPQSADFTFYGGLYRDVDMIIVEPTHFDLDYYGGPGIKVDSEVIEDNAKVTVHAYVTNPTEFNRVEVQIFDAQGTVVAQRTVEAEKDTVIQLNIENVHLWNGVKDPYLYTVVAKIINHNEVIDEVATRIGVRTIEFNPEKGFFLNGVLTPLRGVSRHQDKLDKGNALDFEDHVEDIEIIREMGANTIRLAHYQHAQDFYDLCDEAGLILWAEVPVISVHMDNEKSFENSLEQMKELITQNYNHPSIVTWGISNEITIGGETEPLYKNLVALNDLAHEMDSTRPTTMAQVSMLPMTSNHNQLTDILSYNHYFGWYAGEMEQNEEWFDTFHSKYPDRCVGISEYGCEGIISFHNEEPKRGDYSEEYQALYHEHMAKIIEERPWLWATHVWNMFDFGVDARDEGGVQGRNNKGLVTLDRKTKKDSFYVYKAYLSDEPFVHIASKRYLKRANETINVKVYTNQKGESVKLFQDGTLIAEQPADRVTIFENVKLHEGENHFKVVAGDVVDTALFIKVDQEPESYITPDKSLGVANWFDDVNLDAIEEVKSNDPNYFSLDDTVSDVLDNEEATLILANTITSLSQMNFKPKTMKMLGDKTIRGILEMMVSFGGKQLTPEEKEVMDKKLAYTNTQLQKIKK